VDKGPALIVEVSSSEKPKSTKGQSEIESMNIDQIKKIDHVHHFMDIKKVGEKIKQNILPKIYDHRISQIRMLSTVDYEKERLNIAILEPKEHKRLQTYL